MWCGALYQQQRSVHRCCCRDHSHALYRFENPDKYPAWDQTKKAAWQRRRALKTGADAERVVATEVYARDGWACQLCKRPVDAALAYPHPHSASLDHRTPLSKGGAHTTANTQLAHLVCNTRKRDRITA